MSLNGERSDNDLVQAAKAGDLEAFAELRRRHGVRIQRILLVRLHRRGCSGPDDHLPQVDQDTWTQILRAISQVEVDFVGWSAVLGLNVASAHARKCRKEKGYTSQLEEQTGGVLPPGLIVNVTRAYEARLLLEQAFSEAYLISGRFGQVFEMRWKLELDFDEIAQALGLKKEAIRAIYYRGLRELKRRLGLDGTE